jgi:arsenite transporter
MSLFEKYLSVWVGLALLAGLALGQLFPAAFGALAAFEYANVNFAVALLIWAMVWPMMIGIEFAGIRGAFAKPKGLVITLVVNWLIKPFSMALLGVLFFEHVFAGLIPAGDANPISPASSSSAPRRARPWSSSGRS